jgi:LysR family transcriptional activator of glutamate synthase operon
LASDTVVNLNHLRLFRLVARRLNLTAVSELLHVSQSSISHQLGSLQKQYDLKLYTKNGHGIELTKEGQRFQHEAEMVLKQLDDFEQRLRRRRNREVPEVLIVAGSYGLSAGLLPSVLADLQKLRPEIQVSIRTAHLSTIEQWLLKGDAEIALTTAYGDHSSTLAIEPYGREKLAAFVPIRHRLARRRKVTISELLKSPLILRGTTGADSSLNQMLRDMEERGYRPKVAGFYDSPDAVKVAVRKKIGVGLLYRDLLEREVQNKEFKILTVENLKLYGHTYIMYHKQRPLSANAQLLLKLLRQRKQKRKPWIKSASDVFTGAVTVLAHVFMAQVFSDISVLGGLGM